MVKGGLIRKKKYLEDTSEQYSTYLEQFAYPEEVARDRGYVYFSRLKDKYTQTKVRFKNNQFEKLTEKWSEIFKSASDLQKQREKSFIENMDKYTTDINLIKEANSTSLNIVDEIQKFFQNALINQELNDNLRKNLTIEKFLQAFELALSEFDLAKAIFDQKEAEKISLKFYDKIIDKLIEISDDIDTKNKLKNIPKNSKMVFDLFSTLGLIRTDTNLINKSQIQTVLEQSAIGIPIDKIQVYSKRKKTMKNFKPQDFTSSMLGVRDQLIATLAHEFKGNKEVEIKFEGADTNIRSQPQKTDASFFIPSFDIKVPDLKINISQKSVGFIDKEKYGGLFRDLHFAQKASLSERYQNIRDYSTGASEEELNSLFYIINNEVIRRKNILDIPQLLDILSYISFNWMFNSEDFQKIKDKEDMGTLNLYEINGKIIPTSIIFDLISKKIKKKREEKRVVDVRIYPIKQKIAQYYYVNSDWTKLREDVKKSKSKKPLWDDVKKWVESNGQMAFFIDTNTIYETLKIQAKNI